MVSDVRLQKITCNDKVGWKSFCSQTVSTDSALRVQFGTSLQRIQDPLFLLSNTQGKHHLEKELRLFKTAFKMSDGTIVIRDKLQLQT